MGLTPVEIRHLKVGKAVFGYSREETDRLLTDIADSFEDVWRDRADMADTIEKLEADLVRFRDTETLLRTTLVSAEKAAAEQKEMAHREAEVILTEAHAEARQIKRKAFAELERLQAEARRVRGLLHSALMAVEPAVVEGPRPAHEAAWEESGETAAGVA